MIESLSESLDEDEVLDDESVRLLSLEQLSLLLIVATLDSDDEELERLDLFFFFWVFNDAPTDLDDLIRLSLSTLSLLGGGSPWFLFLTTGTFGILNFFFRFVSSRQSA